MDSDIIVAALTISGTTSAAVVGAIALIRKLRPEVKVLEAKAHLDEAEAKNKEADYFGAVIQQLLDAVERSATHEKECRARLESTEAELRRAEGLIDRLRQEIVELRGEVEDLKARLCHVEGNTPTSDQLREAFRSYRRGMASDGES